MFKNIDVKSFLSDSGDFIADCHNFINEGKSISSKKINEIRLLMADLIALSNLSDDEKILRDFQISMLKSFIHSNYNLTGDVPDFVSKYVIEGKPVV
jgi:hypothetical protein